MDSFEYVNAGEPSTEKLVGPIIGFQNLESQMGVVVDSIDHHLHKVDAVGSGFDFTVEDNSHCQVDEDGDIRINMTTEIEHQSFRELAAADPIDTTDFFVMEDILHHPDDSSEICRVLDQHV